MLASSSKDAGYRESAGLPRASDIVVPRPIRRSPAPRVALVVGIVALALALPFVGMAGRLLSRASSTVSTPLARR